MSGTFEPQKNEAFFTGEVGESHYGIRTGIGITDIDYIVVEHWDKRIGYELAMNGTYIPVVDKEKGEILFSPKQYDEIRNKMKGLSYYNADKFQVDKTAYISQAKKMVSEIFPTGNANYSKSQEEANNKRNAIRSVVERALHENMNLGLRESVSGDLTSGFVEFIDTGSTGRGTNLPGDGDFDFSMKVDKSIMNTPKAFDKFKETLRDVLAKKSADSESSLDEANGNFRYKKVEISGAEKPLDIDITFMPKTGRVNYSTDMSVRERLNGLKETNPDGYMMTIGNIILAKKMLKEEGLYKKSSSPGASKYGGFGGVGVENWILQNGGSFYKAMETFLEAADKSTSFEDFQEIYPIYDFGQNHMAKGYQHDSFVKGITKSGYEQMIEKFKEFQQELLPTIEDTIEKFSNIAIQDVVRNALSNYNITQSEIESLEQAEHIASIDIDSKKQGVDISEQ